MPKRIRLTGDEKALFEKLKNVNREVVDSIMREAQKHNFMEQLNRIG